jgi:hypothetical protein
MDDAHVRQQGLDPAASADAVPGRPPCEACGEPLAEGQRPGTRFCGGRCRAAGSRARRRAELLGRIDALAGELTAIRAQVERW